MVALRKESVDRNFDTVQVIIVIVESLSARRAWIEILLNTQYRHLAKSLSARRAWIEIVSFRGHGFWPRWSLSARRAWIEIMGAV